MTEGRNRSLAESGQVRIAWADGQMPVLRSIRERFERERPLEGLRVAACLHVTSETANLLRAIIAGGARAELCASNPLTTQDDVAAALVAHHDVGVHAVRGEDAEAYGAHVVELATHRPHVTLDDGADLLSVLHAGDEDRRSALIGGTEETTTGLVRLRALEDDGRLRCPVLAVNESLVERTFNDRYGTGQSTLDGILRATNMLLAGRTVVVLGYGWTGKGVALRAQGMGASVIVCEIDPMRALEARMDGCEVMPALDAASRGDVFITVTGGRDVLAGEHFERMKDGAMLANAGHFDVEIAVDQLGALAAHRRQVLPLVEQFEIGRRRLNLLARGRVVNLAAAEGHPAAVMDMSFANQALCVEHLAREGAALPARVLPVPPAIDSEVARLKLASLGVRIDELTPAQRDYLTSWGNPGRLRVASGAVTDDDLQAALEKMRADGVADVAVATFAHYLERLRDGDTGALAESEIEPVAELPDAEELPEDEDGARAALDRTVVIKLNGGLGTSMGMTAPKSLLEVKDGLTFLDITVRQILRLREQTGAHMPLVLMNSFATREASLEALERYDQLPIEGVPADFVQSRVPKLEADSLRPVSWPDDPSLEWAPPGHGDLYPSLQSSAMLEALLDAGYEYAFVANVDNLGAVMEPRILAWLARERIPFLMEVADRTAADRKGGHVARRAGGSGSGLVLREIAQTPDEDVDAFQDIDRHRFFNTNTLWIDLRALADVLEERDGVLVLPMIVNRKTVDPGDAGSPAVMQLETAMGAAIDVFDGACAIRVPRTRFAPVKTTNDLLALRSDAYVLHDDGRVALAEEREGAGAPLVDLDPDHFRLVHDFDARFPEGAPSLVGCERLTVRGDVTFGAGVVVRGSVTVEAGGGDSKRIEDGTVLEG